MLYATTRSNFETATAQRALRKSIAPDGGAYVPLTFPQWDHERIERMKDQSVEDVIADVMNEFFSCKLTGKDIQFTLGKSLVKTVQLNHRITVAEYWRNRDGDFLRFVRLLTDRIGVDKKEQDISEWMQIAVRIAFLFGTYCQMRKDCVLAAEQTFDVAVVAGSSVVPIAAWYARKMGLPVGNIVCCSSESSVMWDFLKRGELKTSQSIDSTVLERLISASLGYHETKRFLDACTSGSLYELNPELHRLLSQGLHAAVISKRRLGQVIANVFTSGGYLLDPVSALCYAGLMDYRTSSTESARAVLMVEASPLKYEDSICKISGLTSGQIHDHLGVV